MNKSSKGIGLIGGLLIIFIGGAILIIIISSKISDNTFNILDDTLNNTEQSTQKIFTATSQSIKKTSLSLEEVRKAAIKLSYDELLRNNEKYIGKIVYYTGEINQVMESSKNNYNLRIYVTKGNYDFWDDDVLVNYEGKRFLEDDVVDIWGEVRGIRKYTTVFGATRSIPEIDAYYIELMELK